MTTHTLHTLDAAVRLCLELRRTDRPPDDNDASWLYLFLRQSGTPYEKSAYLVEYLAEHIEADYRDITDIGWHCSTCGVWRTADDLTGHDHADGYTEWLCPDCLAE